MPPAAFGIATDTSETDGSSGPNDDTVRDGVSGLDKKGKKKGRALERQRPFADSSGL